jgi:flavin-dependent dehydrogenase
MKVIIVGGVAVGASCAARLRRLDEKAEIPEENGPIKVKVCSMKGSVSGTEK